MADQRWYIAVEGNRLGPFPADQLTELAKEGKLEPETLVWRKGMSAWLPARDVPEVKPLLGSGTTESAGTQADTTPGPAEKPAVTSGWFVAEGGTKLGPMTSDKIEALAREGRLEPDSLVWRKGMPQWKAAKEVSEMADALAARPDAAAAAAEPEQEPAPAGEQPEPKPEPAAGPRWYIAYESERIGPFSEEDLPGLLAEKKLAPGSLVWRKGMSAWKRAMEIPELDGILAAAPAPAPASDTSWESEGEAEEPEAAARPEDAAKEAAAVEDIISRIADKPEAETEPADAQASEPAAEEPAEPEAAAVGMEAESETPAEEAVADEGAAGEPAPSDGLPMMEGIAEDTGAEFDEAAETVLEPSTDAPIAQDAGAEAETPADTDAAEPSGAEGPKPAEEVLEQQKQEEEEEPEEEWAPTTPTTGDAPAKPIGTKRPDAKATKPEKPRKQASALILSGLSLATILLCLLPLYAAHVFVVKNSQLNPFAALPPWGAEAAIWGVTVFLPFLGALSALFAPFRFRWAHMGLIWFWILAGAGLGAAWGMNFEAFTLAVQSVFKQAQVDFEAVPQLVSAFAWCADQSVTRVPFLAIVAGVSIAIAVFGVGYLLWRYPRVKWGPMAKPPAPKYGKKKGVTATVPKPAPTPPKEGFSMARAVCRLVFLGWVFVFLPFWLLNELIVIFGWSAQLAFPTARAFEMTLPVEKLKVFLHILPVIALIGMGMVLPRWRPYRGTIRAARLMGLASTVFLVLTCGLLPVNHLLMSRQPKPAPPPPEDVPDVPPPQPDPEPPKPQPPAGLSPAQAETKRAGDQKLSRATDLLQELQLGVRNGRSGLKPKANEVDTLLGGAIELYEKIQVELDGSGAKIPRELSRDLKRATESRKLLRMLRGEMK